MSVLEQRVLDALSNPNYRPKTAQVLAQSLRLRKKQIAEFERVLDRLQSDGRIRRSRGGKIRLPSERGEIVGIVKRVSSGAAYVIPHEAPPGLNNQDVYVYPEDVRDAQTGDEVLVRLVSRRRTGGQRCGKIESVIERATHHFVGTYFEEDGKGWVRIDGGSIREPVFVGDPGAKGAALDDKVVIEILRFPTPYHFGEGVLTEVLGAKGQPGVDTLATIRQFQLPTEFSAEALAQARQQAEDFNPEDLSERVDLTSEVTVTIDPADARDFDDAISLKKHDNGSWTLCVHVADVASFVPAGTPLDREAADRGTSVYLPGRVIPMLPELISNGLASLQQGQVRYTKTVRMDFDPDGVPLQTELANTAIKVNRRFAYEEVLPILESPEDYRGRVSAKVRQLLGWMRELAMQLRRRRFQRGALELFLPDVELDFNKAGQVSGAHEVVHDESHQIIEEFMLAANIAVATHLTDRDIPFLRRAHAAPARQKLKQLASFAKALGYPLKQYESRRDLQDLIHRVRQQPKEEAINFAILRSMKQAIYSPDDVGHYALAEDHYCHFTSPIRRYPDLTVHRLVGAILEKNSSPTWVGGDELGKLGRHCSERERRAADAERDLTKIKLLTHVAERIGDEMSAVITGVERFGFFCRGVELPVEGLVHATSLEPADRYDYEQETFSLIGRRTGKTFQLGDRVRVLIAFVDLERRELDFRLVTEPSAGSRKRTKNKKKAANGKRAQSKAKGGRRKKR